MEAVVLSIYLTNGVPCLGRFPINFKSELPPGRVGPKGNQRYFYHIVLGLAHGSRFGSVGLSRRYTYFQTFVLIPIYTNKSSEVIRRIYSIFILLKIHADGQAVRINVII